MELNIEHRPTAHCENGTISSLLRFYGINLSEPMIFGLASGLYFSHMPFVKMSGMPVTSFRTFPGVLFLRITRLLGIKTRSQRFLNKDKAMKKLDKILLEQHKPVGCVVGMYYLPYTPIEYRFHFNGHNICIIGKDESKAKYSVLDTNVTQKETISYKDLVKVRFAKGGTYPLFGQMYWIDAIPDELPDLKPLILKSIKKTCREMTHHSCLTFFLGTRGIHFLSKRIRCWEKKLGERQARLNLANVIRMLEEIGTGGAGFRFIYGAFLQEAAEITGMTELNEFSKRMTCIGDMWREFAYKGARIIKRRNGENYTYSELGDILEKISLLEYSLFRELETLIGQAMLNNKTNCVPRHKPSEKGDM